MLFTCAASYGGPQGRSVAWSLQAPFVLLSGGPVERALGRLFDELVRPVKRARDDASTVRAQVGSSAQLGMRL